MNTSSRILSAYDVAVLSGELTADAAQREAVLLLSNLEQELVAYHSPNDLSFWQKWRKHKKAALAKGLYIYGDVGRGKSLLMDLFYEQLSPLYPARRVHFHAFMHEIHHKLDQKRKAGKEDPLPIVADEVIASGWLLCFDEFFVQDIADAMILGRLFQLLFDRGIVVVATSNIAIGDLYKNGLQRAQFLPFINEMQQRMYEHELAAKHDYRQLSLHTLARYFPPDVEQEYEKAYSTLIAHLPKTTLTVLVYNREMRFANFHRHILRTDFATLCDQPLGSADYLEIAALSKILFLDDVPTLSGSDNDSRARRFLHLIDCLYDARVKLFMGMRQSLGELYCHGRLDFEFQRCLSRLQEMQSAEY